MHELTSLIWHGNAPLPTEGVIHTLAQSCKLLRHLSVPSVHPPFFMRLLTSVDELLALYGQLRVARRIAL